MGTGVGPLIIDFLSRENLDGPDHPVWMDRAVVPVGPWDREHHGEHLPFIEDPRLPGFRPAWQDHRLDSVLDVV